MRIARAYSTAPGIRMHLRLCMLMIHAEKLVVSVDAGAAQKTFKVSVPLVSSKDKCLFALRGEQTVQEFLKVP